MNQSFPAFVSFHSRNNCFAYAKSVKGINDTKDLSPGGGEKLGGPLLGAFRMRSCDNPNIHTDVQLFGYAPFTNVFINSVFAEVSGFQEKQEVILEKVETKTYCSYIEVAPQTDDDYSVIAHSQTSIENDFLNQIRLVSQNMIIPYFLSPGISVQFRVLNIVPETKNPVILNNETELHVQTVTNGSLNYTKSHLAQKVSTIVDDLTTKGFLSDYVINLDNAPIIGRVLPNKIVESWIKSEIGKLNDSTIYIVGKYPFPEHGIVEVYSYGRSENEEHLQFFYLHRTAHHLKNNDMLNYSLDHMFDSLQLPNRFHCVDGSGSMEPYTNVKIYGLPEKRICVLRYCEIFMDKETFAWIEEFEMTSVLTKSLHTKLLGNPILLSVEGKEMNLALDEKLIHVKVVPNIKGLQKRVTEKTCFLMDLSTEMIYKKMAETKQKTPEINLNRRRKQKNSENYEADGKQENGSDNFGLVQQEEFVQFGSHSKILSELDKIWKATKQHVLITGISGSGKTVFVKKLAKRLSYNSTVTYCKYVPCAFLKGRSADTIEKLLTETLSELESKKPSCLFLDDFDVILSQVDQEQRHLALEKVVSVFSQKLRTTDVSVILVAQRLSTLNDGFVEQVMRARPIVTKKVELGFLNNEDRRELFETYLDVQHTTDVLMNLVQKSDGYNFNEIEKLATSINVECLIKGSQKIDNFDVEKAFECFVACKTGKVEDDQILPTMADVGGMFEQKKLLEQVIIWPRKYPKLFESVGVSISKGILLHGPSGCGKTLLANATISSSKFSVINVKGPELLSKYIGASEENVRLVFEKARSCAPSIIFFDELDSLAPKRGHDSTGVTDRVVNQLLTELDGAEGGMKGVTIIGCTSRIDLIDDALLRPGRFDHHVFCTLPNEIERLDIIKVLTSKLRASNLDFDNIASKTDGWSGADLQLLLTNAQFHNARKNAFDDGQDDVEIDSDAIEKVFWDSAPKPKKKEVDMRVGQKVTLA